MKTFLFSRVGMFCLVAFTLLMAVVLQQVVARTLARRTASGTAVALPVAREALQAATAAKSVVVSEAGAKASRAAAVAPPEKSTDPVASVSSDSQENLPYLDTTKNIASRSRVDRDRQGRQLTRRRTPRGQSEWRSGEETVEPLPLQGQGVRLKGHEALGGVVMMQHSEQTAIQAASSKGDATATSAVEAAFCPYGRPIKCELVFTIDSTMEETPLVGLVMEPVYNNGLLVIPAGAEFHGVARPDRLRDRIFSGQEWVLVFPRMEGRPNGCQLSVQGLALDRVEPDENGLTWGITDGSYGLQGAVMRSLQEEELKRFAATFLSAAAFGLEEREGAGVGRTRLQATPRNAALQGLGTTLEEVARKIGVEIEQHGVFIRVAGGKQFYFYPKQAIFPERAQVPAIPRKGS